MFDEQEYRLFDETIECIRKFNLDISGKIIKPVELKLGQCVAISSRQRIKDPPPTMRINVDSLEFLCVLG